MHVRGSIATVVANTTLPAALWACSTVITWMESTITRSGFSRSMSSSSASTRVSEAMSISPAFTCSRRARMATWPRLSSPVTYSTFTRPVSAPHTCSSSVLLPAPGSPPISTTEPGTRPPPSTRSSSPLPEDRRGRSSVPTSANRFTLARSPA